MEVEDHVKSQSAEAYGINISTKTVRLELHGIGLNGQTAACKLLINKNNGKCQMECKAQLHWTLEQWKPVLWSDESRFSV